MVKVIKINSKYYSVGGAIYDLKGSRIGWISPFSEDSPLCGTIYGAGACKGTLAPSLLEDPWEAERPEAERVVTTEFESIPSGSEVRVNDVIIGTTPTYRTDIEAGDTIEYRLSGYKTVSWNIEAGEVGKVNRIIMAEIIVPPPVPEEKPESKLARLIIENISEAAKFLFSLSHPLINIALEAVLRLPEGEALIEKLGIYGFNKLVEEAPEYEVLRKAPKGSVSIVVILGLVSLILGIGTVVGWLRKEAPEPSGMAVWAAVEAKDWKTADTANKAYKIFIEKMNTWLPVAISWFNPFLAAFLGANRDSQLTQADAFQKVIDAGLEAEPEEEKWERILSEQERRRELEKKEEEEYWERVQSEAERSKREARIEEAEYFENIRREAETRAAERKIEEEAYWAKVREGAEISEMEKREAAEEYWARVRAEEEERRDEERAYWDARLAGPKKSTITISSDPPEADVYIDGEYKFVKTPYTILLPGKTYVFRVQKEGYYPVEITAEIEEDEVATIPFVLEAIPEPEVPLEPYVPQTPYYPGYVPAVPYVPDVSVTPSTEVPSLFFPRLYPEVMRIPGVETVTAPIEKELLVNIETTDLMPTKGRIYSIAFLDLTTPGAEIQVSVSNDETALINEFLSIVEAGAYTKLVGYNVSFDYRYIFTKMMLYRRSSKTWKNIKLRDIMQIMKQVKEEFVFGFNKPGTLDAWGKMILGRGKYGSQELLLRQYISGNFDYVRAFQVRQIELSSDLYTLARFVSSEAFITRSPAIPAETEAKTLPELPETTKPEGQKTCPVCKAFQPLASTKCGICGTAL